MAGPKLCEIVAIATGKKSEVKEGITALYHKLQKAELFDGLSRSYSPRNENGEALPPESKSPQASVSEVVSEGVKKWAELFDTTFTLDSGNCQAKGEVSVNGTVLLKDIPVPTLLFLEKQLTDIRTFISKIPVLDPAEKWTYDEAIDSYRTDPAKTARTKKEQRPIVLYDATKEHPAQTQLITEDVIVGDWTQTRYSTRWSAKERTAAMERVNEVIAAVVSARERANGTEVKKEAMGESLLKYIFK